MSLEAGELNKYNEVKVFPTVDLTFTSPKRSLVDRVSGNASQFTRNTIGTYVDSNGIIQTATAGEPRYTYDPLTGEELGLLVEESRTNYANYSAALEVGSVASNPPGNYQFYAEANAILAPDGTQTGTYLKLGYFSGPTRVFANQPERTYTISCWVRRVSGEILGNAELFLERPGTSLFYSITEEETSEDEWRRITFTETLPAGTHSFGIRRRFGVNATLYAWGLQVEEGSFATSYIPTSGSTITRDPEIVTLTNTSIYDNERFDIVNQPFGSAAGSNELTLLPTDKPIERVTIFSPNIAQSKINTFAEKTDEFWRWRVTGSSFGLPNFSTNGQVTVDWDDGTVETLTTSDHTFTDGKTYHEIGFRLDSGTYFRPRINANSTHKDKLIAIGPAPSSMILFANNGFNGCSNLEAFDGTIRAIDLPNAWLNCNRLTSFPLIDISGATSLRYTWQGCSSLTSFPLIDTSSVTLFERAWYGCSSLTSFPLIDTSSGTSFFNAWYGCGQLTTIPANLFDTTGTLAANAFSNAFVNDSLSAQSIENILVSLVANGATGVTLNMNGGGNANTSTWSTTANNAYLELVNNRGWTITQNGTAPT
jgi:hypothetical protein